MFSDIKSRHCSEILPVYFSGDGQVYDCTIDPDGQFQRAEKPNVGIDYFANKFVTEGLVDLQVNGFAGVDFNNCGISAEQLDCALAEIALSGVTTFLPTLITSSKDRMIETLRELDALVSSSRLGQLMVAGYHIEGPFLSPKDGYAGAHDAKYMISANIEFVAALQAATSRPIRLMTVAPEVSGVIELIATLTARGIRVAIGHSAANLLQIQAAVDAGATLSTHLGNGLPHMLHKTDNQIFWQLAQDKLTAMLIADGIHVPRPALQSMVRAKGLDRVILTTDAVAAAGRASVAGFYTLGETEIELSPDGAVSIPGSSYLAGSAVTMDKILRNMINWYGYTIPQVLTVIQTNPDRMLGRDTKNQSTGNLTQFVEWSQSTNGPQVVRTHIGPFTIEEKR